MGRALTHAAQHVGTPLARKQPAPLQSKTVRAPAARQTAHLEKETGRSEETGNASRNICATHFGPCVGLNCGSLQCGFLLVPHDAGRRAGLQERRCQGGTRCEGQPSASGRRRGTRGPVKGAKDVCDCAGEGVGEGTGQQARVPLTAEVVGRRSWAARKKLVNAVRPAIFMERKRGLWRMAGSGAPD